MVEGNTWYVLVNTSVHASELDALAWGPMGGFIFTHYDKSPWLASMLDDIVAGIASILRARIPPCHPKPSSCDLLPDQTQ